MLINAHDLTVSPTSFVINANELKDKTTVLNEMLQTNLTYLKIIDWVGSIY